MIFLATGTFTIAQESRPDPSNENHVAQALYEAGCITAAYLKDDGTGIVLVINSDSAEAAHELIQSFPFVEDGVLKFDVAPVHSLFASR